MPYKQLENNDKRIRPGVQFLIFTGIFIGFFIAGNLIGAGLVLAIFGQKTFLALGTLNFTAPHFMPAIWILQIAGTTLPILVSAIFFSAVIVRDIPGYIKPRLHFPWGLMVLILAAMFVGLPLIEFLSNLNQKVPVPHWLEWMSENEKNTEKLMTQMLNMKGLWDVILNVLFIGLFTAIAEEFMFRGVLQTIFCNWTKNIHVAIWITAILFSAFHMEYFGFFPRLLLGLLFGYFVAWSGSIWTGVWAHFINNATIVVVTYLFQQKVFTGDVNNQHVFSAPAYLVSFIVTGGLLFIYHRTMLLKNKTGVE
ncbi:CPBP family intramembrane glutamic endopeptidase [Mucilaginibacter sp. L3T2-6]|uniref:CPBP family intramembrane glutamic endopeptidase n=1 Tax=Mucilaginibacter sp. L3T2-6 TaxID=3062491 RepID=UPI00267663DF|nr:type II CAAX endopeptidase family protein [Mucilaginibacter sp. L3T2-6]MDO3641822.1 type II CAAX endopeptidase family protein [Mucilaginibacter sp. L3T2-6]MDV6214500.1 type II CAAX endopeptidase family protein [Mucilaginibacter sp. L3T2-6]